MTIIIQPCWFTLGERGCCQSKPAPAFLDTGLGLRMSISSTHRGMFAVPGKGRCFQNFRESPGWRSVRVSPTGDPLAKRGCAPSRRLSTRPRMQPWVPPTPLCPPWPPRGRGSQERGRGRRAIGLCAALEEGPVRAARLWRAQRRRSPACPALPCPARPARRRDVRLPRPKRQRGTPVPRAQHPACLERKSAARS